MARALALSPGVSEGLSGFPNRGPANFSYSRYDDLPRSLRHPIFRYPIKTGDMAKPAQAECRLHRLPTTPHGRARQPGDSFRRARLERVHASALEKGTPACPTLQMAWIRLRATAQMECSERQQRGALLRPPDHRK